MGKSKQGTERRLFLKQALTGAAVLVAPTPSIGQQTSAQQTGKSQAKAAPPNPAQRAQERETPAVVAAKTEKPGSDYMVDVIKSLGIEYYAANPSSTLKSLHESLINYGGNSNPEFITCTH